MGMRDHIPGAKKSRIGDAGRASEKKLAKSLGARMRPASGAMAGAKGDMTMGRILIEAKSTVNESFSLKYAVLGKISQEALSEGKAPALAITFTDPKGKPVNFGEWVMLPKAVFQQLIQDHD